MLLTITGTTAPATDLGHLLHKHPDRTHAFDLSFGKAHVFFPEASDARCTAALYVEVDPVGLVRRPGPAGEGRALEQYVNDRPYAASSFLSVALADVFGTAMAGRSKARPELAEQALPYEVALPVVPCRGGESVLRRLFEPLGYALEARQLPLDERRPDWGASRYFSVVLRGEHRLADLLSHLYVLLPVLDDDKHYWVGDDEVEKLVRHGAGWLARHPARELVARRFLKHRHSLTRQAIDRLLAADGALEGEASAEEASTGDEADEKGPSLNEQRLGAVLAVLKQSGAKRVLDLGCGEGRLVRALLEDRAFEAIVAVDVSHRALEVAADRLKLERMPERQRERVQLLHGSLFYRDARLEGFDAAAIVEVIEHMEPARLPAFERVVFGFARPRTVVLTTPNAEHNVRFENLPEGQLRHHDHRFEWTRAELAQWARGVAERFGYEVRFLPVGPEDQAVGAPTQMAVFTR